MSTPQFTYSICEPLNPNIIQKGAVSEEAFRSVLETFPWLELLRSMESAAEDEIHFSPSLELKNVATKHSLAISIVGPEEDLEYYIFYRRPKTVKQKKWFKTVDVFDPDYMTDRTGQTASDVMDAFDALLRGDHEMLENRWG